MTLTHPPSLSRFRWLRRLPRAVRRWLTIALVAFGLAGMALLAPPVRAQFFEIVNYVRTPTLDQGVKQRLSLIHI